MRALTADNRLNSIRCAWDGAANNSTSRLEVNGSTARRNLFTRPVPDSVNIWSNPSSGWGGTSPLESITDGFYRITVPYAGTTLGNRDIVSSSQGHFSTTAVKPYVGQVVVRGSFPIRVKAQFVFITSGLGTGNVYGPAVSLEPGQWATIHVMSPSSLASDYLRLDVDTDGSWPFPAGATIDIGLACIEETTVLRPPFTGDTKGKELLSLSLSTNPSRYGLAA